jgi:hypothetical protein
VVALAVVSDVVGGGERLDSHRCGLNVAIYIGRGLDLLFGIVGAVAGWGDRKLCLLRVMQFGWCIKKVGGLGVVRRPSRTPNCQ